MFINKLNKQSKAESQKMPSYVSLFLKTEITCIPKLLNGFLGDYYNNALCNGATWVFLLWWILHIAFDKCIEICLKKLRYLEYARTRLKTNIWYLIFYGIALCYFGATLSRNEAELFNFKRMHAPSSASLPSQVMLSYTLMATFFLHTAFWKGLSNGLFMSMFQYIFLFGFMVSSYILRIVEISFTLVALMSFAQVPVEFTKFCFMASVQDTFLSKFTVAVLYVVTFAIYIAVHLIVIPLTFVVPLGLKLMSDYPNILLLFLFFNLLSWLIIEIYESVVFRFIDHCLYHKSENKKSIIGKNSDDCEDHENVQWCSSTLLECSLFKPRDDVPYNLRILRREIKARKTKMMSMRKPKNVFLQTLKCMVAIKRKLHEKRLSRSSDSEESEKSENSNLHTNGNANEQMGSEFDRHEKSDEEHFEMEDEIKETDNDQTLLLSSKSEGNVNADVSASDTTENVANTVDESESEVEKSEMEIPLIESDINIDKRNKLPPELELDRFDVNTSVKSVKVPVFAGDVLLPSGVSISKERRNLLDDAVEMADHDDKV